MMKKKTSFIKMFVVLLAGISDFNEKQANRMQLPLLRALLNPSLKSVYVIVARDHENIPR